MIYSQGYPCFYGAIGCGYVVNSKTKKLIEIIKIGTSYHIANRKSGYSTAWPSKPIYNFVIVLDKDSISSSDLYKLDAEFLSYIKSKNLDIYHIEEDGGKEFYDTTCPTTYLTLLKDFLTFKKLSIIKIIEDDPFPIRDLTSEEKSIIEDEDKQIKVVKEELVVTLKQKFFTTFLYGKVPRRIQDDLWDIFESICNNDKLLSKIYKGIVQWPTGTGKTIAMLLMIVLIKERCVRLGRIYRGLLLSRTNDIFDTIKKNFTNLSKFGIKVCDGTNAKLSTLDFPDKEHILIIATHAALIQEGIIQNLPKEIIHFHYDEVHRIGGEVLYKLLSKQLELWFTEFLTGTSATPLTSSANQRDKITKLFGNPINMIHQCGVEEAVNEGWIAKPRFIVVVSKKIDDIRTNIEAYVDAAFQTIVKKMKSDGFHGGKSIVYLEGSIQNTEYAYNYAKDTYKNFKSYCATDNIRTDNKFCDEKYNKIPMILFACERYLEGSDIEGLEITARFVGESTSAHSMIQVSGRALRLDFPGKEGWCMIFRPSQEGTTSDDVLDSIVLDIIDLMGKSDKLYEKKDIVELIKTYMGSLSIDGNERSLDESVDRIHAAYVRREYTGGRISFIKIREICIENHIKTISQYNKIRNTYNFPETPWKDNMSAYDFFHPNSTERIGIDEFKSILLENNIRTTERYIEWIEEQEVIYPSIEEAIEGYFHNIINFQDLLPEGKRRR